MLEVNGWLAIGTLILVWLAGAAWGHLHGGQDAAADERKNNGRTRS